MPLFSSRAFTPYTYSIIGRVLIDEKVNTRNQFPGITHTVPKASGDLLRPSNAAYTVRNLRYATNNMRHETYLKKQNPASQRMIGADKINQIVIQV